MTSTHYHLDDCPQTLALLGAMIGHRDDLDRPGYTPTSDGARIDWDTMATGLLSPTEQAVARIAQGLAVLEQRGGAGTLDDHVPAAVTAVLDDGPLAEVTDLRPAPDPEKVDR